MLIGSTTAYYVVCYDSLRLSSQSVCEDIAENLDELVENAMKNKAPR